MKAIYSTILMALLLSCRGALAQNCFIGNPKESKNYKLDSYSREYWVIKSTVKELEDLSNNVFYDAPWFIKARDLAKNLIHTQKLDEIESNQSCLNDGPIEKYNLSCKFGINFNKIAVTHIKDYRYIAHPPINILRTSSGKHKIFRTGDAAAHIAFNRKTKELFWLGMDMNYVGRRAGQKPGSQWGSSEKRVAGLKGCHIGMKPQGAKMWGGFVDYERNESISYRLARYLYKPSLKSSFKKGEVPKFSDFKMRNEDVDKYNDPIPVILIEKLTQRFSEE